MRGEEFYGREIRPTCERLERKMLDSPQDLRLLGDVWKVQRETTLIESALTINNQLWAKKFAQSR